MNKIGRILIDVLCACFLFFTITSTALADDYNDGLNAYNKKDYVTAIKLWKPLAKSGHVLSQYGMGILYDNGQGIKQDLKMAHKWISRAANQGNVVAQSQLGSMYIFGRGINKDLTEARQWFRKAAVQGYAKAQSQLGNIYQHGMGTKKDLAESKKWYLMAAKQGNQYAKTQLGLMRKSSGLKDGYNRGLNAYNKKDYVAAIKYWEPAAKNGHLKSQLFLGLLYEHGLGINMDLKESRKWYRKAAIQGSTVGQKKLDLMKKNADLEDEYKRGLIAYNKKDYVTAIKYWEPAAINGHVIAQYKVAYMYSREIGGPERNYEKAIALYRKVAKLNPYIAALNLNRIRSEPLVHANSQLELAKMYLDGKGVAQDHKQAGIWYQKAIASYKKKSESGNAEASYKLSLIFDSFGEQEKYTTWTIKAASQGFDSAQFSLGNMYSDGRGVIKDEAQAVKWFTKAAEQGGYVAQFNVGLMYATGQGVKKDNEQAFNWYKKSARQGYARAQYNLAIMYVKGHGVKKDITKAFNLCEKAAKQGDLSAMNTLGALYYDKKNSTQALYWYTKSARGGNVNAQFNLGRMYSCDVDMCTSNGEIIRDFAQAIIWYSKAAKKGDANAQYELGSMYQFGRGIEKDIVQALSLYTKAAKQGHELAKILLGHEDFK